MSDFTQIKLPAIYYHLEKMQAEGLLDAVQEKDTGRPEKTIYSITDKGKTVFENKLKGLLKFEYRPSFASDGVFYFSDALDPESIIMHLKAYIKELEHSITILQQHKNETLQFVPDKMKTMAKIIFSHHQMHYQSELDWANESLKNLN